MPSLAQRLAFPSATGPLGRNRDRRVSALSIYSDIVWDYSEETGRIKDSRINWGAELSSGSALITYPGFCEPMKDYVDAHASGRVVKTRKLKTGSLKMWVYTMFSVVDFHVQRGKHSFVELLPSDHDAYLLHLRSRTVSAGSVNRLFAAKAFWQSDEELGLNMADFGPKPPYINSSPYALLHIKSYGRKAKMQTEVIPDDVLWPLFNVCVEYVEKLSPYILALKRRLDAAEAEYAKYPLVPGGYRPTAPKRLQALFRGIRDLKSGARIRSREVPGFGKVEIKQQAFDDFVKGVARPNPRETTLLPNGVSNLGELRAEIRHLETACYILLGLVTGMRHSELDSVEENGLEETASVAGNKILWVHGVLRKTSKKDKDVGKKRYAEMLKHRGKIK